MKIKMKRVYEQVKPSDGYRVLVDRLWPRGVRKDDAKLDAWCRELAPSTDLRNWFGHDPDKWPEFERRYRDELNQSQLPKKLLGAAAGKDLTLVYASREHRYNNARVLKKVLEDLIT